MFHLMKGAELTLDILFRMLSRFQTQDALKLKENYDYYMGEHKILNKSYADTSAPNSTVVTNFCNEIANIYTSYLTGIPVQYSIEGDKDGRVLDVLRYNDVENADQEFLSDALIFGRAFNLLYVDSDKKVRFARINPLNCFSVHSNDCDEETLYFVRWYKIDDWDITENEHYICEVYDYNGMVKIYSMAGMGGSLELLEERPTYFSMCPAVCMYMPDDESCIFEQVKGLNDAFNELESASIDIESYFADSYMIMTGCVLEGETDEEKKRAAQRMRENRIFELPSSDASMTFLEKNNSNSNEMTLLNRLESDIMKIACCPRFDSESFGTASGVALKYKMSQIDLKCSKIEQILRKALLSRIERICSYISLVTLSADTVIVDTNIHISHNIPTDVSEVQAIVNTLISAGASKKTIFENVPYINDVDGELEAVEAERDEMSIYQLDFNPNTIDEDEEELPEEVKSA